MAKTIGGNVSGLFGSTVVASLDGEFSFRDFVGIAVGTATGVGVGLVSVVASRHPGISFSVGITASEVGESTALGVYDFDTGRNSDVLPVTRAIEMLSTLRRGIMDNQDNRELEVGRIGDFREDLNVET